MQGGFAAFSKIFQNRDELSFGNIRWGLWPLLLAFPFSAIAGNSHFFQYSPALIWFQSSEAVFFLFGIGWLVLARLPKRFIIPLLRLCAAGSAVLTALMFLIPAGGDALAARLAVYIASVIFKGLSIACAFFVFCFALNNVERLFGMALLQVYYGFRYISFSLFPAVHIAGVTVFNAAVFVMFLAVIFFLKTEGENFPAGGEGGASGIPVIIIGLSAVHYCVSRMINYIEWAETGVSISAFGLGTFFSIIAVLFIQILKGKSALWIWLLFLVLSLFGLGALLLDTPVTFVLGSFFYGLGDSLGFIIIHYMCAGAIKRSASLKMFRLFCFVSFVKYSCLSVAFALYFNYFDAENSLLAFSVVFVMVTLSLFFMPVIQKRLFEADWTDGLFLKDMGEYALPLAQTREISVKEGLNLTDREGEVFTMLLNGTAPKEIAWTLKISYDTVRFHQKNLYRKLGIQSRAELFAKYLGSAKSRPP